VHSACFNRDSPDESQTGINVRVFPAFLQDRRQVLTATSTRLTRTLGRGSDLAIFPGTWTHSSRWLPLMHEDRTSHARADGGSSRSSAIIELSYHKPPRVTVEQAKFLASRTWETVQVHHDAAVAGVRCCAAKGDNFLTLRCEERA